MFYNRGLIIIILIWFLPSCNAQNKTITVHDLEYDIIKKSIANFSKVPKLYEKDSVFVVWIKKLTFRDDVIVVTIGSSPTKILLTPRTKVGSKGTAPSRYLEKDGKLFFWWDNNYELTEEIFAIFSKYNLWQDDENGINDVPSSRYHESRKGAHYYYCKTNPNTNKRKITRIGLGAYEPPVLKCTD